MVAIKEITRMDLPECVPVIQKGFGTVAIEFGLTRENCPTNGAFIGLDRLETDFQKGNLMFGLYDDVELVGFMQLEQLQDRRVAMEKITVLPKFRHNGYGKALLSHAISVAAGMGAKLLTIGIIEENTVLKNWYAKNGFAHTGIKKFDHLPFTVGFMEIHLSASQERITIRGIQDKDEKTAITLSVMNSLPKWFSPPEDIIKKSVFHREFPFFSAFDGSIPVGFAALKIHNPYTADIFSIGVLENRHRQGVGHLLVKRCEDYCKAGGFRFLTVKTLDGSAVYEPYDRARAFYLKEGFLPLEVFTDLWDKENPCLFLTKYLG